MFSNRKVGGIRFIRIGRINLTLSVSRAAPRPAPAPRSPSAADGSGFGDVLAVLPLAAAILAAFF